MIVSRRKLRQSLLSTLDILCPIGSLYIRHIKNKIMSPTLNLSIRVKRSYACEHVCRVDLVRKLVFEHHSPALLTLSDLTVDINGFSVVVATSCIEVYDFDAE